MRTVSKLLVVFRLYLLFLLINVLSSFLVGFVSFFRMSRTDGDAHIVCKGESEKKSRKDIGERKRLV